jgi:hypothetical protein
MDNDASVLQDAAATLIAIDIQYKLSDFNAKKQLKKHRDKAFNVYAMARLELLTDEVICTDTDVQEMKKIRQEIEQAAETQTLIDGILHLVTFLVAL